jgi:hypothetical protein
MTAAHMTAAHMTAAHMTAAHMTAAHMTAEHWLIMPHMPSSYVITFKDTPLLPLCIMIEM